MPCIAENRTRCFLGVKNNITRMAIRITIINRSVVVFVQDMLHSEEVSICPVTATGEATNTQISDRFLHWYRVSHHITSYNV